MVVLPTPDAGVVSRFASGDENALVTLYRHEYDDMLAAAGEYLGQELSHFRARVAHKAMLDSWHARERFRNAVAFSAFLEEAVRQESDIQRRKHAALHHREGRSAAHVSVMSVDDAVEALLAEVHAPVPDPAASAEAARAVKRAHAAEHVERVAAKPKWLLYGVIGAIVLLTIAAGQQLLDRAGSEVAVDRAFKGDDLQTLTSGKGQRGTVTLRDGTIAAMGSETLLRIPSAFATTQRTLELDGTATFTVSPTAASATSAQAPFAVRVGAITVTTTGTTFTVRHFPEDSAIVVQVSMGTVELKDRTSGAVQAVNSGETVRFQNGTFTPIDGVARDVALAWTRDSLVFENTPLARVIPELVRWFGINAALIDASIESRPVSMRLALNSSGEATRALTEAAQLTMSFGKDDRLEFSAAPLGLTKPAAVR